MSGSGLLKGVGTKFIKEKAKMNDLRIASADKFMSEAPGILTWEGQEEWQKPRHEVKYFHHRKVEGWSGYVRTKDIKGWVGNVRIEMFVEKWKRDHTTTPTNEEIMDWMLHDPYKEFRLVELGDSLLKNGVRQSIVVKADGTLLDGNRRYFAALFKLGQAEVSGDKTVRQMVSQLPAFVLGPSCRREDFDAVLVEENFVDDCREPWPPFIRANKVYEAYKDLRENGNSRAATITDLVERFGMKKAHIDRWIKMMDFIEEFYDFHIVGDDEGGRLPKDEYDVKWKTQEYFEYFDELTKAGVAKSLEADPEFRDKVFERLFAGEFLNFKWIRELPAIASDVRAKQKFMLDGSDAVTEAMRTVKFREITHKAMDVNDRVFTFLRFVKSLTVEDIDALDVETIEALGEIAEKVAEVATTLNKKK